MTAYEDFVARYPSYRDTAALDELRSTEYRRLDEHAKSISITPAARSTPNASSNAISLFCATASSAIRTRPTRLRPR
jgi:hypothetical protein